MVKVSGCGESPPSPGLVRLEWLVRLEGLVMSDGESGWEVEGVEESGLCIVPADGEVTSGSAGRW